MVRQGLLEPHDAQDMLGWEHGGGFSLNASVRIEATDREGLERLIRYCARPPFALERLHLVGGRSDQILYILPKPDPAGRTALRLSALEFLDRLATILPPPRIHRHRYHGVFAPNAPLRPLVTERAHQDNALAAQQPAPPLPVSTSPTAPAPQAEGAKRHTPDTTPFRPSRWAALLARIYEVFPLICPTCQAPLTFIAFLTDPESITQILAHIGEPTSPPLLHPARGPPQTLIPQIEYWISFELWGAVKRSPIYGGRDLEEGEDLDLEIGEVGMEDGDLRSFLVEAVAFEEAEQA